MSKLFHVPKVLGFPESIWPFEAFAFSETSDLSQFVEFGTCPSWDISMLSDLETFPN